MEEANTLCCPDGTRVPILEEWQQFFRGEFETRYVFYRKEKDIFYTKDLRGAGEDLEHYGDIINKNEIYTAYESTMLQFQTSDQDFDFIKRPPLNLYTPGATDARDCFAQELSVYERMRQNPHPGICKYKGCIVVDGYVEGIVLERYRCTLYEAVEESLSFDAVKVMDTITDAVAHLHSLELVHNDLSPHNILFDDDLNPVIADMETCMPEGCPPILKMGSPAWSGNWKSSALANDEIALKRIRLYLNGLYDPPKQ